MNEGAVVARMVGTTNVVVLSGLSGGDPWDEKPAVLPCEAVAILLTHDLGPSVCFPSFPVSLPFPLILVS